MDHHAARIQGPSHSLALMTSADNLGGGRGRGQLALAGGEQSAEQNGADSSLEVQEAMGKVPGMTCLVGSL